jgi:hypothetical protein
MDESVPDFMKIWTQADIESERKFKTVLLNGLDAVVQSQSDVLARIKVDEPIATPVVRWMEERGYPSTISAQLIGNNLVFSGHLFGKAVTPDTVRQVIRDGTILERPRDGCQVKVVSVDELTCSVTAYGNTSLQDDPEPAQWDIITEVWSD